MSAALSLQQRQDFVVPHKYRNLPPGELHPELEYFYQREWINGSGDPKYDSHSVLVAEKAEIAIEAERGQHLYAAYKFWISNPLFIGIDTPQPSQADLEFDANLMSMLVQENRRMDERQAEEQRLMKRVRETEWADDIPDAHKPGLLQLADSEWFQRNSNGDFSMWKQEESEPPAKAVKRSHGDDAGSILRNSSSSSRPPTPQDNFRSQASQTVVSRTGTPIAQIGDPRSNAALPRPNSAVPQIFARPSPRPHSPFEASAGITSAASLQPPASLGATLSRPSSVNSIASNSSLFQDHNEEMIEAITRVPTPQRQGRPLTTPQMLPRNQQPSPLALPSKSMDLSHVAREQVPTTVNPSQLTLPGGPFAKLQQPQRHQSFTLAQGDGKPTASEGHDPYSAGSLAKLPAGPLAFDVHRQQSMPTQQQAAPNLPSALQSGYIGSGQGNVQSNQQQVHQQPQQAAQDRRWARDQPAPYGIQSSDGFKDWSRHGMMLAPRTQPYSAQFQGNPQRLPASNVQQSGFMARQPSRQQQHSSMQQQTRDPRQGLVKGQQTPVQQQTNGAAQLNQVPRQAAAMGYQSPVQRQVESIQPLDQPRSQRNGTPQRPQQPHQYSQSYRSNGPPPQQPQKQQQPMHYQIAQQQSDAAGRDAQMRRQQVQNPGYNRASSQQTQQTTQSLTTPSQQNVSQANAMSAHSITDMHHNQAQSNSVSGSPHHQLPAEHVQDSLTDVELESMSEDQLQALIEEQQAKKRKQDLINRFKRNRQEMSSPNEQQEIQGQGTAPTVATTQPTQLHMNGGARPSSSVPITAPFTGAHPNAASGQPAQPPQMQDIQLPPPSTPLFDGHHNTVAGQVRTPTSNHSASDRSQSSSSSASNRSQYEFRQAKNLLLRLAAQDASPTAQAEAQKLLQDLSHSNFSAILQQAQHLRQRMHQSTALQAQQRHRSASQSISPQELQRQFMAARHQENGRSGSQSVSPSSQQALQARMISASATPNVLQAKMLAGSPSERGQTVDLTGPDDGTVVHSASIARPNQVHPNYLQMPPPQYAQHASPSSNANSFFDPGEVDIDVFVDKSLQTPLPTGQRQLNNNQSGSSIDANARAQQPAQQQAFAGSSAHKKRPSASATSGTEGHKKTDFTIGKLAGSSPIPPEIWQVISIIKSLPRKGTTGLPTRKDLAQTDGIKEHFKEDGMIRANSVLHQWSGDNRLLSNKWWQWLKNWSSKYAAKYVNED